MGQDVCSQTRMCCVLVVVQSLYSPRVALPTSNKPSQSHQQIKHCSIVMGFLETAFDCNPCVAFSSPSIWDVLGCPIHHPTPMWTPGIHLYATLAQISWSTLKYGKGHWKGWWSLLIAAAHTIRLVWRGPPSDRIMFLNCFDLLR